MPTSPDLSAYTDEDFAALRTAVLAEGERRSNLTRIPQQIEMLNGVYLDANGQESGTEWSQPTGAFDAYPQGWQVMHNGKTWESTTPANVWEPGVSSWREVVQEGALAEWVQPTGATDAYAKGARVSHNGHAWTSLLDANVWEPAATSPTLWQDDGPTPVG